MKNLLPGLLAAVVLIASNFSLQAAKPLRVLIVTGGCCHDYTAQKNILAEGIGARANAEFTVVQDPSTGTTGRPSIYQKKDWARGFDAVIHNECFSDEKDPAWLEHILEPHRKGLPAVVIHCAMHCYRAPTNSWFKFVGVRSHRHGNHFSYYEENRIPQNPIMAGFPRAWVVPREELYNIEEVYPGTTVLAAGWSHETARFEPNIWTSQFGKGRVFGTTLGHYNQTLQTPVVMDTLARGLLWACGKLDTHGQPKKGFGPRQPEGDRPAEPWSLTRQFPEKEHPRPLFNRADLSGWKGRMEYWSATNGIIVARNSATNAPKASTYLLTREAYRNFRLIFEGKLVTSEMHSGISFWGKAVEREGDPNSYQGHLSMFPAPWGVYDLYRRNLLFPDDGRAVAAGRAHEWNQIEILAIGSRVRVVLNGKLVGDWTDPKPELCGAGPIGLQLHSNNVAQEVHFRGLILSEDPEDRLITVP